jgi:peptidyl-prolyl cis-trans isomerase C
MEPLRRLVLPLARHPVLQFAVLGGAIFALSPSRQDPRRVEVAAGALTAFERAQAQRDGVPALSTERAREVDARAIEDEVLYREALRLGLDRDDPIIRQRLIQKLLLLVEDLGGASRPPTDAQLRAWFEADPTRFAQPPRVHLVHVFASAAQGLPAATALERSGVPSAGEPFPYSREVRGSRPDLTRLYGEDFAALAFRLPPGEWSLPVRSSFGWHRVRVVDREAARIPSFEEARPGIGLDYALDRRSAVVGEYLRRTVGEYRVAVDGRPLEGFTPTRRIAVRAAASAED